MNIIVNTIQRKTERKPTLLTIERICALYVVLWIFVPPVQIGSLYRLIAVACAVIWFVLVSIQNSRDTVGMEKFLQISLPCMCLLFLHAFPRYGFPGTIIRNLQFIIISICALIAIYYSEHDTKFIKQLICISMIFMVIFSITTIQGLIEDPYASRIANSEWMEERFVGNENVGLYGYIYMCVMLAPMLLFKIINRISFGKFFDFVSVVLFLLVLAMTILSGYMIANFCFVLGCSLVLLFNNPKNFSLKLVLLIGTAVFILLFYEKILSMIFAWLMDAFQDNPVYYSKLIDFRALFLSGDASGSTIDGRFSNYLKSIRNALNYPLVGSYLFGKDRGGGHTDVIDTIGRYGWLVAFLKFKIYWYLPYQVYKTKYKHFSLNALIAVFILFGIFDPYSQEICIPLYLFLPYVLRCADELSDQNGTYLKHLRKEKPQ